MERNPHEAAYLLDILNGKKNNILNVLLLSIHSLEICAFPVEGRQVPKTYVSDFIYFTFSDEPYIFYSIQQ
jgi:hypothetical protein